MSQTVTKVERCHRSRADRGVRSHHRMHDRAFSIWPENAFLFAKTSAL